MHDSNYLEQRYNAIENKIKLLTKLRVVVGLNEYNDLEESQWEVIESQLQYSQTRYLSELKRAGRNLFKRANEMEAQRELNELLGKIELKLSKSFTFYDTFLDILSQRLIPGIGPILRGCDVLAYDSISKNHPALCTITKPIVYFDRGFGASTRREGVFLHDGSNNPVTTIQIPYTKLSSKYTLTSIVHETGHSVMIRLGLAKDLLNEIRTALASAGANASMQEGFANWSKEIGPDFWGFLNCGISKALAAKELLSLPRGEVFNVSFDDPHPPPYLRVLMIFDWCRRQWGKGEWDNWESEWRNLYPLAHASERNRNILKSGEKWISIVSRVLFTTKFRSLGKRSIPSLFDMDKVSPHKFRQVLRDAERTGMINLKNLTPCGQLGFFGYFRLISRISEKQLDRIMTKWLIEFGNNQIIS